MPRRSVHTRMAARKRIAIILGTRPEAIKLTPVIKELVRCEKEFKCLVVSTGQHREMLDQVLGRFGIVPDVDLEVMQPKQDLASLASRVIQATSSFLAESRPDIVVVQGDTTTAFVASLASFYAAIPIAHVEAGLRSHDLKNPWPEEGNRRLTSVLADIHFAPTVLSRKALTAEGVAPAKIVVTGNTVVDALHLLLEVPFSFRGTPVEQIPFGTGRTVLVTSHRRESWGEDLRNICLALKDLVGRFSDLQVVWPVHLNPNVRDTVNSILADRKRIHLTEPLDYLTFVNVLRASDLILTDSGGVQEEAPTLSKPLLLLRDLTERPEAFNSGFAEIVGTKRESIVEEASRLLRNPPDFVGTANPYGDGKAASRICKALGRWAEGKAPLLESDREFGKETSVERSWTGASSLQLPL